MRSGRPLSGQVPVQATRVSAPASQFQSGLCRLELRRIEAGQRKQRVPVHRRCTCGRLGPLRRNRFEEREPSAMIEFYAAHSRVDRGRILAVHDPRRQQIGVKRQPRQRVAALSIPELQRRGRLTQDVIPFGRWLVRLLDVLGEIAVPHERVRIVGAARRLSKLREGVPGFLREDIRVVFGTHAIERTRSQGHRERDRCAREHGDEHRPRHTRT